MQPEQLGAELTEPLTLTLLHAEVTRQAALIIYLSDFRLMLFICLAVIPLLLLLRKPAAAGSATRSEPPKNKERD